MRRFLLLSVSALTFTVVPFAYAETKPAVEETIKMVEEKTDAAVETVKEETKEVIEAISEKTEKASEAVKETTEKAVEAVKEEVKAEEPKKEQIEIKKEEPKKEEAKAAEVKAEAPPVAPAPAAVAPKSLADVISDDGDFDTFLKLLKKAGMEKVLSDYAVQHTLFIPTDAAFDKAGDGVDELIKSGSKQQLSDVLNFHIVNGMIPRGALDNNSSEVLSTTLKRLRVVGKGGKLTVNGIKVDDKELTADNGIVYKIEKVIDAEGAKPAPVATPAAEADKKTKKSDDDVTAPEATESGVEAPVEDKKEEKTEDLKSKLKFW